MAPGQSEGDDSSIEVSSFQATLGIQLIAESD